jgi:hypothetical protein
MGRLAALLTLTLCVGCSSTESYLSEDGIWGDLGSRFSSTPRYAPTSPVSSPAFYPDLAPAAPVAPSGKP